MEQEEMSILTQQGFSEAVSSLSTLLFSVSFSLLRDKEACADAAQNAILHAWQKRGSLRDPKKFKSWIVRITINECKTLLRGRSAVSLTEDIPYESKSDDVKIDVNNAVHALPVKYRLPIVLFYYEDMTISEIADALKLPEGTVMSQLKRAREKLRKELLDYGN